MGAEITPTIVTTTRRAARRARGLRALAAAAAIAFAGPQPALSHSWDYWPSGDDAAAAERSYSELAERRDLQARIDYLDGGAPLDLDRATGGARAGRTGEDGAPRAQPPRARSDAAWLENAATGLVAAAVLAAIIAVFALNVVGGGAFARKPRDGEIARPEDDAAAETAARDADMLAAMAAEGGLLARLRAMADRREALRLMLVGALRAGAAAHDMRLGRSWTARDALRAIPRAWRHWPALRRLTEVEERVRFAGAPLSEQTFEECLELAAPLLRRAEA
ncbi:MAG: DUF4129 domain-containing protein [Pseudomonadota bacterium]